MESSGKCLIWGTNATLESFESAEAKQGVYYVTGHNVTSVRTGGRYAIDKQASDLTGSLSYSEGAKARLTTWLINQRQFGHDCPRVDLEVAKKELTRRPMHIYERADRLLKYIFSKAPNIGGDFYFFTK